MPRSTCVHRPDAIKAIVTCRAIDFDGLPSVHLSSQTEGPDPRQRPYPLKRGRICRLWRSGHEMLHRSASIAPVW
jgi:hypothetical protein